MNENLDGFAAPPPAAALAGESMAANIPTSTVVEAGMRATRIDKHERPKGDVAEQLRQLGLEVEEARPSDSYDLLINGCVRVALRVAYPGMRRHRVTVGRRSYEYRYQTWHFNFHHHGRIEDRYTDYFVCIATELDGGTDRVFVIPWEQVSGKTFSLHCGRGRYRGRYAPFLDAWHHVADGVRQRCKQLRRVA